MFYLVCIYLFENKWWVPQIKFVLYNHVHKRTEILEVKNREAGEP